jgi:hypothetical protein
LQDLQNTLLQIIETSPEQGWVDRPGGVFLRRADLMPPEDQTLLEAVARVVMDGVDGNLRQQLKRPQIPYGDRTLAGESNSPLARRNEMRPLRALWSFHPVWRCPTASAVLRMRAASTS